LDKGEGAAHPIGVGEVIKRVIGKCVMKVTKEDVLDASGSLQVCGESVCFFKVDKLIINGQVYRGAETEKLPYYGLIMNSTV